MKKYFFLLLLLTIITTSTAIGGPPPRCLETINPQLQKQFHITFQNVLSNPVKYRSQWEQFKSSRAAGSWDSIVKACCPQCSVQDRKCFGCSCNVGDECMWSCRCCWVEGLACGAKIGP